MIYFLRSEDRKILHRAQLFPRVAFLPNFLLPIPILPKTMRPQPPDSRSSDPRPNVPSSLLVSNFRADLFSAFRRRAGPYHGPRFFVKLFVKVFSHLFNKTSIKKTQKTNTPALSKAGTKSVAQTLKLSATDGITSWCGTDQMRASKII